MLAGDPHVVEHQGQRDHPDDHVRPHADGLQCMFVLRAERVAEHRVERRPEHTTHDVEDHEGAKAEVAQPGQGRHHRAHHDHEPGDEHGRAAPANQLVPGPVEHRVLSEAGVLESPRQDGAADRVANQVGADGGGVGHQHHHHDVDPVFAGEHAAQDHGYLAGDEEAHPEAGLGEQQTRHDQVDDRPVEVGEEVAHVPVPVRRRDAGRLVTLTAAAYGGSGSS